MGYIPSRGQEYVHSKVEVVRSQPRNMPPARFGGAPRRLAAARWPDRTNGSLNHQARLPRQRLAPEQRGGTGEASGEDRDMRKLW